MRLSSVLMVYFLMGAVMYGGGMVGFGKAGVTELVISDVTGGQVHTNQNTSSRAEHLGGPIEQAVNTIAGGGLLAAWKFLSGVINFMFWPISALVYVDAPSRVVVLVGGAFSFAFLIGLVTVFRRGA